MGPRLNFLLIVAVLAVIVIRMSVFTVDTREHALKFQVGRIVRADYQAGLHFKVPFFENVARYPKLILNYDEDSEERFLTGEKKNLTVRSGLPAPPHAALRVTETKESIAVDAGAVKFNVPKSHFAIVEGMGPTSTGAAGFRAVAFLESDGRPGPARTPEKVSILESGPLRARIDTFDELDYFRNGGILHYVLRGLAREAA